MRVSPREREGVGRPRRAVPLARLAELDATADVDSVALLEQQSVGRVPDLVPVRYGRMLVSPFTFYRGAALLMAADLAQGPRTGLTVQLCGDAHLSNFGLFASPERRLVFDVNDFDETNPGPFEWDVKRLAASLEIAGRDNGRSSQATTSCGHRDRSRLPTRDPRVRRPDQHGGVVRPPGH